VKESIERIESNPISQDVKSNTNESGLDTN